MTASLLSYKCSKVCRAQKKNIKVKVRTLADIYYFCTPNDLILFANG